MVHRPMLVPSARGLEDRSRTTKSSTPTRDRALAVATPAMPAPAMTMVFGVISEGRASKGGGEAKEMEEVDPAAAAAVVVGARREEGEKEAEAEEAEEEEEEVDAAAAVVVEARRR